jgi:hypothetical protein
MPITALLKTRANMSSPFANLFFRKPLKEPPPVGGQASSKCSHTIEAASFFFSLRLVLEGDL